jgi:cell division septum initiation protein DivIVA
VVEIEIQHLVDRLESLLNKSWLIPLTSNRIINEEEYLDIIDQMRITIPAEIKQAKRMQQERERIIAQAQEEAERIVAQAREQATSITSEHEVLKVAEAKTETLLKQAQQQAEDVKAGADAYAIEVLSELEEQLMAFLTTVRNGLKAVQRERGNREDTSDSQAPQF